MRRLRAEPTTVVRTALWMAVVVSSCTGEEGAPVSVPQSPGSPTPVPGRVVELDTTGLDLLREVEVGPDPLLAAATTGALWTTNLDDATVSRVDVGTGEVSQPAVGEAVGIASDETDVWVASDGTQLLRLDGETGAVTQEISLADRPLFGSRNAGFLVVGAGSVWITVPPPEGNGRHELWRVDPDDGTVDATIPIGSDPFPPVAAAGAIWMADAAAEVVVRVDMESERVSTRDIGSMPGAIAGSAGRVWATTPGAITELDPATGRPIRTIAVAGPARGLAWVAGRLWMSTDVGVSIVNVRTGAVEAQVALASPSDDGGPIAVVPIGSSVWVTIEVE